MKLSLEKLKVDTYTAQLGTKEIVEVKGGTSSTGIANYFATAHQTTPPKTVNQNMTGQLDLTR